VYLVHHVVLHDEQVVVPPLLQVHPPHLLAGQPLIHRMLRGPAQPASATHPLQLYVRRDGAGACACAQLRTCLRLYHLLLAELVGSWTDQVLGAEQQVLAVDAGRRRALASSQVPSPPLVPPVVPLLQPHDVEGGYGYPTPHCWSVTPPLRQQHVPSGPAVPGAV
jgi:hypothetical protein